MGWSVGYDSNWKRDIGYGVPAYCDHPGCTAEIDRGLGYVCGGEPYGGEHGCGLYVCTEHSEYAGDKRDNVRLCKACRYGKHTYLATADHPDWIAHKLADESWQQWRDENPDEAAALHGAGARGGA
ncbi:hypothetical protein SAMN05216569_1112 [Pseudoxanthomonas sp. CF125]|nr:hypothetical protein SAMN05216569_1112 [Pseudoxanthomonas sp. CF125]